MYVISRKRLIRTLSFLIGLSLGIGYFFGMGIARGPKTEEDAMNSAIEIEEFIQQEVDDGRDLEVVFKEAKIMGQKEGLIVTFVNLEKNLIKVNIIRDLDNKTPLVKSFKVQN